MRRADLALLGGALVVLLAWPLTHPPIWTRGEAREALVVRDIVRAGHWVIAVRDGTLASKPPFFHWIAATVALVAGPHDVVVRLPSALGAFVMLAATGVLGTAIGGRPLGTLAMLILAATSLFWSFAMEARVDMVFAAATTVTLVAAYLHDLHGRRGDGVVCLLGAAAATLTKGPAGLALPVLTLAGYLAIERRPLALVTRQAWPFAGAAALVAAWYAAAIASAGRAFLHVQVVHENVDRLLGTGDFHRGLRRALHLPGAFVSNLFPWNLALLEDARQWWRDQRADRATHFLHAWWITLVLVLACATRTRSVYLLPAYPAIALLAARALLPIAGRTLRAALVVAVVVIVAVTHSRRLKEAHRDPLPGFAARIASRIADAGPLRAAANLPENDALVLRWLLDRSIVRGPLDCDPDVLVLVPGGAVEKARAAGFRVVDRAGTGDRAIALLDCDA